MIILKWFVVAGRTAAVVVLCRRLVVSTARAESNPQSYAEGDRVALKVNALTSTKTLLPMDYYRLPFCQPDGGAKGDANNLGQFLAGDLIQSSPYVLRMKKDMFCEHLCVSSLGRADQKGVTPTRTVRAIRKNYHNNWIVDNLPAASKLEDDKSVATRYWHGFPVGFINEVDSRAYIHNHVNIEIQYNVDNDLEPGKYRIVRFTVQPFSVHHEITPLTTPELPKDNDVDDMFYLPRHHRIKNPIASCDPKIAKTQHTSYNMVVYGRPQEASGDVLFTYDVIWIEQKDVQWSHRWHVYVTMDDAIPARVHWIAIVDSLFYAVVLSGLVAILLVRNVRGGPDEEPGDNTEDEIQESLNDKGYALVHVDYFRPPEKRVLLLAIFCGAGAQILASFMMTSIAAVLGYLHSSERGRFVMVAVTAFPVCGVVNGFVTVQVMKLFKTSLDWTRVGLVAAIFFPGITFLLLLGQRLMTQRTTLAFPWPVILTLLALWLCILVPLTYLGAYAGNRTISASLPTTPRTVLLGVATYRSIRNGDRLTKCLCVTFCLLFNLGWLVIGFLWLVRTGLVKLRCWRPFLNGVGAILVGGLICLGSIYVEAYYMFSAVWMEYYYSTYGFMLFVAIILFWTCGVVSILSTYVYLTLEESHSWWWQFLCSGAVGMWLALYSIFYATELELDAFQSVLLYSGYMAWASFALFLMTGFVGFMCSLLFVRAIFSIGTAGRTILEHEQGFDLRETVDESQRVGDESATTTDKEQALAELT